MNDFVEFCKHRHDVEVNQKYAGRLPYSFHLDMVWSQAQKFMYLSQPKFPVNHKWVIECGCYGHDLIEDARMTYNDIKSRVGKEVAEIIFACTESMGRDREERHDDAYFERLRANKLGLFVKLCDIIANIKMGLLENSSMFEKYKKEYSKMKQELFCNEYEEMFDYIEKIFAIND